MKKSELAGLVATSLVTAVISGGACTYTPYDIEPTSAASGIGGGATSISTSGTMSTAASSSGGAGGMTASSSSGMSSSSSVSSSGSGNCKTDGDKDGAISWQCAGGTDCADQDANAHPEPMVDFQAVPISGLKKPGTLPYDFNCDGAEMGETSVLNCSGLACDASKIGFQGPVACGASAPKGHCAAVGCAWTPENPPLSATQKCK